MQLKHAPSEEESDAAGPTGDRHASDFDWFRAERLREMLDRRGQAGTVISDANATRKHFDRNSRPSVARGIDQQVVDRSLD